MYLPDGTLSRDDAPTPAPSPPPIPSPASPSPPSAPERTTIPFELWETLAYDIVLHSPPDERLAESLQVTPADVQALRANPHFARILSSKLEEVQALGDDAPFAVKFRVIANKAAGHFLQRLTSSMTSDKDFTNLFRTAVELAKLMPKDTPQAAVTAQAAITFNIQGVPGLEHLSPTRPPVIDHDPTPPAPLPVDPAHALAPREAEVIEHTPSADAPTTGHATAAHNHPVPNALYQPLEAL